MARMAVRCVIVMVLVCSLLSTLAEGNKYLIYGVLLPNTIPQQKSPPQPANNYTSRRPPVTAEPPLSPPSEGVGHHT